MAKRASKLIDVGQLRTHAYIHGEYVTALSGATFATTNPATEQVLAEVASCDSDDVNVAVKAAKDAFSASVWSRMAPAGRKNTIRYLSVVDRRIN